MRTRKGKLLTIKQGHKNIRARHLVSFRRYLALKGSGDSVRDFLNMNAFELREHIESQWLDGMNWDNYGWFWCVDHIVALKYFDPTNFGEMEVCWSHYNLIPAYMGDNHAKGYAPEISEKMLLRLPDVPMVRVLIDKARRHILEFEPYYNRTNDLIG